MLLISFAHFRLGIDSLDSHKPHQSPNPLVIDTVALAAKACGHTSDSVKRSERVLHIDQIHQLQIEV